MEHVKRLVLVPEHMVDQRKKPLVPPLTAQVQEIDSDMQDIMQRQDIPIGAQAKVYDQNLQRYLTFYDKRMNKPLRVNVVKPAVGILLVGMNKVKWCLKEQLFPEPTL